MSQFNTLTSKSCVCVCVYVWSRVLYTYFMIDTAHTWIIYILVHSCHSTLILMKLYIYIYIYILLFIWNFLIRFFGVIINLFLVVMIIIRCHRIFFLFGCSYIASGSLAEWVEFANVSIDWGSIPGRVIPKTQIMVLNAVLLKTHHCKVKWSNPGNGVAPSFYSSV